MDGGSAKDADCAAPPGCGAGGEERRIARSPAGEWRSYGRTTTNSASPRKAANIGGLGVTWWAGFDTGRGQEATPLEADGMLFTTTAWSKAFAFDARTGRRL